MGFSPTSIMQTAKNKSNRKLSHSSHETPFSSPKIVMKGRKKGETIKIKSKTTGVPSKSPTTDIDDPFNDALLNLSNGSFFESENFSEHKTSSSLAYLRASLSRMDSLDSFQ